MRHTGVITGQVMELNGKPVRVAIVSLFGPFSEPEPPKNLLSKPFVTVRVNSRGQFRAGKLPPGKWVFRCEAKGYYQLHDSTAGNGMFGATLVENIVVLDEGTATAPQEPVKLFMYPEAVVLGRILDSEGRPVTNQKIWLIQPASPHSMDATGLKSVDEKGFFEMKMNGDSSHYKLSMYPFEDTYGEYEYPTETAALAFFVPGRPGYGPLTSFVFQPGKRTRQDFRLVRGASVSGTVYASDGKTPVAGATVGGMGFTYGPCPFEFHARANEPLKWERSVTTDADGHYTKKVVPGVESVLVAGKIDHGLIGTKEHKVRLRDGEYQRGVDFVLKEAAKK